MTITIDKPSSELDGHGTYTKYMTQPTKPNDPTKYGERIIYGIVADMSVMTALVFITTQNHSNINFIHYYQYIAHCHRLTLVLQIK